MQESRETTVVLADDHAIVREGIAALCAANGMQILGQCSEGAAAVEMIAALKPDFAILDLNMPGISGIEVIRRLRASGCAAKLLILSISREEATVMEALRAGADAYLLKDGPRGTCWMPSASFATAASTSPRCCAAPAFSPGPKHPRRRSAGLPQPPRDGGLLLPREWTARQGYRGTARHQPQDRGHLPRQPDAQAQRPRPGRPGQVRHRTQPHEHFRAALNSMHASRRAL